jgi:4-hydroxybenzoate polyprenyltransferase
VTAPATLARRFSTYQAERFPVFKHGLLIAVFAGSAVAYAARLNGLAPTWGGFLVAAIVCFLIFFELRVADEHKDFEDDQRFRPERPVPRGLISLAELRALAFVAAAMQAFTVLVTDVRLVAPLLLVWSWAALMSVEFFAPAWLKARPALYLVSHMAIMPLIALFALSCGGAPPRSLGTVAFLALAFLNGLALEIGRKAWAPQDEREGVETYSRLWGVGGAAAAVGAAGLAAAGAGLWAAVLAGLSPLWFAPALAACGFALYAAATYAAAPTSAKAKRVETAAGLFTLAAYASLSLLPLLGDAWTGR